MKTETIDLTSLVNPPKIDSISGRGFGEKHAIDTGLLKLISNNEKVLLKIDETYVKAINDSFIKGFFNQVFKKFKTIEKVQTHFILEANDYYKNLIVNNWKILERIYNV